MLRCQTSRPEPTKKKAWNELVGPALQRPAKSQKGASKATLRNGETAWCRGFTCTHFRPPFEGLRGQTLRPERTKKRLGMSLSAQHYQDQHRGRKGRQKPPSETGKQHGVAGSRAPIFGLRLEGCDVKRRVQNLQKKGLEGACRPNTTKTSIEAERGVKSQRGNSMVSRVHVGVKSHPPKRGNSMLSRVHVHQFSASVWRAARSNVASRTYKKKAWNELVGPALQRPAKSQKGASKATLRNGETAWCRGFTCTGGLRGQTLRPEPTKKSGLE